MAAGTKAGETTKQAGAENQDEVMTGIVRKKEGLLPGRNSIAGSAELLRRGWTADKIVG